MKGSKTKKLSGRFTSKPSLVCMLVAVIASGVMGSAFFVSQQQARQSEQQIKSIGELRILSQQIASYAAEAAIGKEEAFPLLKESLQQLESNLQAVNRFPLSALPVPGESMAPVQLQLESLNAAWSELKNQAELILVAEGVILSLHEITGTFNEAIPQLQLEYNEVLDILLELNTPASQIAIVQRQPWLAERILGSLSRILNGGEDSIMAADSFSRDIQLFDWVLKGMLEGNSTLGLDQVNDDEVRSRLADIADIYQFVAESVDEVLNNSPELFQVRASANNVFMDSQQLLQQASVLSNSFFNASQQRQWLELTSLLTGVIALFLMVTVVTGATRQRQTAPALEISKHEMSHHEANRLLDEISDLASNDHESADKEEIAETILISIERLRTLIETVNQTAGKVDDAAREAADVLSLKAKHQASEINAARDSVADMSEMMIQVSENATNSATVAERAVHIASNGGLVVQNSIEGMTNIRDYIQNTSRRIKHLGESSQEISDIISLINDIADQTNILSLNAAIQASMAGEAGRGFAVVADEVQRLSERVSDATRQAGGLISTIKSDSHEAVTSMEQTVSEVVHGVRLAQDAGVALEEIEQISQDLASLIQGIAEGARGQAETSAEISTRMSKIRDISFQASSGSDGSSKSIENLAQMASDMRQSVADIKLPETKSLQDA